MHHVQSKSNLNLDLPTSVSQAEPSQTVISGCRSVLMGSVAVGLFSVAQTILPVSREKRTIFESLSMSVLFENLISVKIKIISYINFCKDQQDQELAQTFSKRNAAKQLARHRAGW